MIYYFLLDSKVIGKRYLKFFLDITELPYKLRIGKETSRQNGIYAIESIIKARSTSNKIER